MLGSILRSYLGKLPCLLAFYLRLRCAADHGHQVVLELLVHVRSLLSLDGAWLEAAESALDSTPETDIVAEVSECFTLSIQVLIQMSLRTLAPTVWVLRRPTQWGQS